MADDEGAALPASHTIAGGLRSYSSTLFSRGHREAEVEGRRGRDGGREEGRQGGTAAAPPLTSGGSAADQRATVVTQDDLRRAPRRSGPIARARVERVRPEPRPAQKGEAACLKRRYYGA